MGWSLWKVELPVRPGTRVQDWVTQQWVKVAGRRVALDEYPWLSGPIAGPEGVGSDFFHNLASASGWEVRTDGAPRGLLPDMDALSGSTFHAAGVEPSVRKFYEETSDFDIEVWAEWSGLFRPFGWLLSVLFSRRLQQLNVPLGPMDSAHGTTSEVSEFVDPVSGEVALTSWVRHLRRTGRVLYAGSYSTCSIPGHPSPCVKVVFPLPTGNGLVILRPSVDESGALIVTSAGKRFGDPGFYFTVHRPGNRVWARYVRSMTESIRVYPDDNADVRADHTMWFAGMTFLRLHYRLTLRRATARPAA